MLQESTRGGHQKIHFVDGVFLLLDVLAADEETRAEGVVLAGGDELLEDLHGELARGGDDEAAEPVLAAPLGAVETLDGRDDEREGLPTSSFGGTEDVATGKRVGDGGALDGGQLLEARVREAALGGKRERHVLELAHTHEGGTEALLARLSRGHS